MKREQFPTWVRSIATLASVVPIEELRCLLPGNKSRAIMPYRQININPSSQPLFPSEIGLSFFSQWGWLLDKTTRCSQLVPLCHSKVHLAFVMGRPRRKRRSPGSKGQEALTLQLLSSKDLEATRLQANLKFSESVIMFSRKRRWGNAYCSSHPISDS
jgi:hypothetical protein